MDIAFFGSSLVSAYWNGAATYYRGVIRALHARGHHITFYEPDAYQRQQHRDIDDPFWATVVVYAPTLIAAREAMKQARGADAIVKASGVGIFDDLLERELLELKTTANQVVFWDVDAPATLDRVHRDPRDPFLGLIPRYDAVFTYGGGDPVTQAYWSLGARVCVPIYNGLVRCPGDNVIVSYPSDNYETESDSAGDHRRTEERVEQVGTVADAACR